MATAVQERCVTAWRPSWDSATASPPPSTGSGLRTDGGRLSPFCLRPWSWPISQLQQLLYLLRRVYRAYLDKSSGVRIW